MAAHFLTFGALPPHPLQHRRYLVPGAALAALITGAMAVPAALAAQAVAEVQVAPEALTLRVGERKPVLATGYDAAGNVLTDVRFRFTSTDTTVALVDGAGMVTAVRPGLARVDIRSGTRGGAVTVAVRGLDAPAPAREQPAALRLADTALLLLPGEQTSPRISGVRADGSDIGPIAGAWHSADPQVARVDLGGVVTAIRAGRTTLDVEAAGLRASLPVTVEAAGFAFARTGGALAPGQSDTLRVLVPSQGNRYIATGLTWASSDPAVLSVSADGVARGVAPGRAEAVVRGYVQEGRLAMQVHPRVESVVAEPATTAGPLLVPLHGVRRLSVIAEAADGTPIPEALVRWSVQDTAVARYDPATGLLRGDAAGSTVASAIVHGFAPIDWAVRVVPGELALEPRLAGLVTGDTIRLAANLVDERGEAFGPPEEARWRTDDATVADLAGGGLVRAAGPGRATLSVTAPWGATANSVIHVTAPLIATSERDGRPAETVQGDPADPAGFRSLLPGSRAVQVRRSPDGTRLVYASDLPGDVELYAADADGGASVRLTNSPGFDGEPAWLLDGGGIVFVSARQGRPRIWRMAPDGTGQRPLGQPERERRGPAPSPDGRWIAAIGIQNGRPDVVFIDAESGDERAFSATALLERFVAWADDGTLLVASQPSASSTRSELARMDVATGIRTPVAGVEGTLRGLALNRDRSRAVLLVQRGTADAVVVVPLDGGSPFEATVPAGLRFSSPDFR